MSLWLFQAKRLYDGVVSAATEDEARTLVLNHLRGTAQPEVLVHLVASAVDELLPLKSPKGSE